MKEAVFDSTEDSTMVIIYIFIYITVVYIRNFGIAMYKKICEGIFISISSYHTVNEIDKQNKIKERRKPLQEGFVCSIV